MRIGSLLPALAVVLTAAAARPAPSSGEQPGSRGGLPDPPATIRQPQRSSRDPFAWSPDFKKDTERIVQIEKDLTITVPTSNLYIDERAVDEYERFKKYFSKLDIDLL